MKITGPTNPFHISRAYGLSPAGRVAPAPAVDPIAERRSETFDATAVNAGRAIDVRG